MHRVLMQDFTRGNQITLKICGINPPRARRAGLPAVSGAFTRVKRCMRLTLLVFAEGRSHAAAV